LITAQDMLARLVWNVESEYCVLALSRKTVSKKIEMIARITNYITQIDSNKMYTPLMKQKPRIKTTHGMKTMKQNTVCTSM
jgi:hypothetical protein